MGTDRMFDPMDLARRIRARLAERTPMSDAAAAEEAGVSRAAFSRAKNCAPDLSHENALRLEAWLKRPARAAAA